MTGDMTATDGNTLAFTYDKELVVFEYKNGRWQYHSRFSVAKLLRRATGVSSIAVKGNIIAVGVEGNTWADIKGVVGIYQRNLKDDGWSLLKALRDPDATQRLDVYSRRLFGSRVSVTENYEVVTFIGDAHMLNVGLYVYDCRSERGKKLYMAEPESVSFREAIKQAGIAELPKGINNDTLDFFYYKRESDPEDKKIMERNIASEKEILLLRVPYLDKADMLSNINIMGRIIVFEKKGSEWNAACAINADRINLNPMPESELQRLGNFIGLSKGTLMVSVNDEIYAFEKSADGLWELIEHYGLWGHLKGSKQQLEEVSKVAFDTGGDDLVAITTSRDVDLDKYKITVYRKTGGGWEKTDEIIPEDLPEIRTEARTMPIVVSNDMIVVSMERPPYYLNDGKRRVSGGGDLLIPLIIAIIKGAITNPVYDTAKLNRYPGRVCIYRLLPEKGYVLEDIIVRDRDKWGRLYFKSAVY
jgi:hypothetical protein